MGIQRLPFGMYLKYGPESHSERHAGEFNALKLVRKHTSIPVPFPIDLILSPTGSFMVTSRVEGDRAGLAIDECTDQEMSLMAQDLRSWIAELHAIKMPTDSSYAISGTSGGACLDYRIGALPVGPFRDEKEFNESLRLGILPNLVHRNDHEIVFTHSDLTLRNILVKDGRISGVVDWENAGWYPEYWEYTKCHFGVRPPERWPRTVAAAFENKYEEELKTERQYWEYASPF
jgi:aminoglycoside phosphotransferase